MRTIDQLPSTDADTEAILEMLTTGKPIPAEIRDRIRARGRKLTEELLQPHGIQDISAQLIRESRDE